MARSALGASRPVWSFHISMAPGRLPWAISASTRARVDSVTEGSASPTGGIGRAACAECRHSSTPTTQPPSSLPLMDSLLGGLLARHGPQHVLQQFLRLRVELHVAHASHERLEA